MKQANIKDFRITSLDEVRQIIRNEVKAERAMIDGCRIGNPGIATASVISAAEARLKQWQHTLVLLADVTEV